MSTKDSLIQRELAELVLSVDDGRQAGDPFKLSDGTRQTVETRLATMEIADSDIFLTESGRATASGNVRTALDNLNRLLRDGYNHVQAIPSVSITDAQRLGVFIAYGWSQGEIGRMNDDRVESLAHQAISASPTIAEPTWRYPDAVLDAITTELATLNVNQPLAGTGDRQQATAARETALRLLTLITARVRFLYCSATDDTDTTTELARIGRQPRRSGSDTGGGTEPPAEEIPAQPGTATFDSAALTLTIPELPEFATTIRAYRQKSGEPEPELAGTSTTTTVSLIEVGPLEPNIEYQVWVVGHNSAGDGPPSNIITITGPV